MEQQGGNHNVLCRMGCGFYGNPMYDGMCSKCHKDNVKRRQQTSSPTQLASGRVSPHSSVCTQTAEMSIPKSGAEAVSQALDASTISSLETATPTVAMPNQDKTNTDEDKEDTNEGALALCNLDPESPSDSDKKAPKKNRCHTCKKKLGLTGFPCRCGGLFCGTHRYSDKHECSFNYKELAQGEIRKNNPVIVAAKIQKI